MTFHAAYEPQRAIRTERWKYIRRFDDYPDPVLANCDDSASKELLIGPAGGAVRPREQLYDLVLDPAEGENLAAGLVSPSSSRELRRPARGMDAGDGRSVARRPCRAAPVAPRSTSNGQVSARRAAPDDHGRSHGRSIQARRAQSGTSPPSGVRISPRAKVERAALRVPSLQMPSPTAGVNP